MIVHGRNISVRRYARGHSKVVLCAIALSVVVCSLLVRSWLVYATRVAIWDRIQAAGKLEIESISSLSSWFGSRGAFGLCLATPVVVSAVGDVNGNQIIGCIRHWDRLKELRLEQCRVTDEGLLNTAKAAPQLKILSLAGNDVTDRSISKMLSLAPRIEVLNLTSTMVSDEIGTDVMRLSKLQRLVLQDTNIGVDAFSVGEWSGSPHHLSLRKTSIGSMPMVCLPHSLLELDISENGDVSEILNSLAGCDRLQTLNLGESTFRHAKQGSLVNLTSLRSLILARGIVDSQFVVLAADLQRVTYVELSQCSIDERGWEAIRRLPSLALVGCQGVDMRHLDTASRWTAILRQIDISDAVITAKQTVELERATGAKVVGTPSRLSKESE